MLILQCSPRPNGSCATLAQAFASGLAEALTAEQTGKVQIIRLADLTIRPCIACDACSRPPHHCRLDPVIAPPQAWQTAPAKLSADHKQNPGKTPHRQADQLLDQARWLLDQMTARQPVLIISPVYFYALPAMLKALVDRSQRFYHARPQTNPAPSLVALLAGRSHGRQLFTGSLLTLNYFLSALGRKIDDKRLLPGQDLIQDRENGLQDANRQIAAVRHWGRQIASRLTGSYL